MDKMDFLLKYLLFCFLVFSASIDVHSQIVSSAMFHADSVQLGDPIKVDIKVILPSDIKVEDIDFSSYKYIENLTYQQDTNIFEKYADIEILDFGSWKHDDMTVPISPSVFKVLDENGKQVIKNTITLAIYNIGVFAIRGPKVNTVSPVDILSTEAEKVKVYLPLKLMQKDTVELNPIKDIMHEKSNFTDYLIYIYLLIGLLFMSAIGYYFYKRKKETVEINAEPVIVVLLPHEKALNALSSLNEAQLWQKGLIKEYQTSLTDIIRLYLQDRYGIKATELTTYEITHSLQKVNFNSKYISTLHEILQVADLVKFAKATPEDNIHAMFMAKAIDFVEQTKDSYSEINPEL